MDAAAAEAPMLEFDLRRHGGGTLVVRGVTLPHALLMHCKRHGSLSHLDFNGWDLSGLALIGLRFDGCSFDGAFGRACFDGCVFQLCSFLGASFSWRRGCGAIRCPRT